MRLIDADALKEKLYIDDDNWNPIITEKEIDEAPTAYDVEEVVKELEKKAERYMKNSEKAAELGQNYERHMIFNGAKGDSFEEAIDIVKNGGVI